MAISELIKAIELRKKYNRMKFEDFIIEFEKYKDRKIPQSQIDWWKFTGLNNTDFIDCFDDLIKLT